VYSCARRKAVCVYSARPKHGPKVADRSPEERRPPATQQREVKPQLRNLVLELGCSRGVDGGGSLFCALNTLKSPLNGALTPSCYDGDVPPVAGSQGFSLGTPSLYVDIAARVTEGRGTGSVRPLFRARRLEPLVDRRRARLARKGVRK